MAYTRESNYDGSLRKNHEQQTSHGVFVEHFFDEGITTTPQKFSALIAANNTDAKLKRPFHLRTHVELTNCNAAGTIYVGRSSDVSSTKYQWILNANGGYIKEPFGPGHDFYIVGSGTLDLLATEVG